MEQSRSRSGSRTQVSGCKFWERGLGVGAGSLVGRGAVSRRASITFWAEPSLALI